MSGHTPGKGPKRQTWRDRRCHHGKPPAFRVTLDITHCDTPGCWDDQLRDCGLASGKTMQGLLDAARNAILCARTDSDTCPLCLADLSAVGDPHNPSCGLLPLIAAIAKAEGR